MNVPSIYNFHILEHIVMRMLCGGQARMIGEDSNPRAHGKTFERGIVSCLNLTMLLRKRCDPHTRFIAVKIKHMAVTAAGVDTDRPAVF